LTSSGKTLTSQSASAPFSSAVFLYLKLPIGLARSRFRRRQPLDRPTLRNNPPPRLSSRNDEDFKRGHLREPIRQRAILDADCRPCPSFLRLARDNGISGANMRQRIASAYLRIGEIKEKASRECWTRLRGKRAWAGGQELSALKTKTRPHTIYSIKSP
jgi:hypothetical protein